MIREAPLLSTTSAHALAALFALAYVGSIYVSRNARLSFSNTRAYLDYGYARPKERNERWRDDPNVIRARLFAVSTATILSCTIVFALIRLVLGEGTGVLTALRSTIAHLGIAPTAIQPHLITPTLFLGPLYAHFLLGTLPFQKNWSFHDDVLCFLFSITGIKNYIIAPITEEIVFRACVLTGYHLARASMIRMIFLSPLVFGAAHIHHAWDTYNRYGRSPAALKRAVVGTIFQFTYTSIFGFYCSYLFLRTGSIFPPIVAHMFCNIMGVPQPSYEIRQRPDRKLGVFHFIRSSIVIAYLAGIIGFVFLLPRWTYMEGSLYWA
ncbi:CAAX protease self-immunity-domain-containing protein [Phlebopus sp. FC_14]|nr:CAAX protease self-immunity-domain-containing protein [Phlebopus sp. FC_14]